MATRGFAQRTSRFRPFRVMDFLEAASRRQLAGEDVIHMEVGEPTFPLPARVQAAAQKAITDNANGYTPSLGISSLRQAIAGFSEQRYGITLDPERVVVTTGSSAALGLVCDLLLNAGDSLLVTDPGYPCNANFIERNEAQAIRVPVGPGDHFQLTPASIARYWQPHTAGVLVASPSNPTGDIIGKEQLADLYQAVRGRNGHLIVDEIYHGLIYQPEDQISMLEIADDAYVINSFSKYFAMPGWRLGWVVVPEAAIEPMRTMTQNFFISPPTLSQAAALAALHPESIATFEERREELQTRRDFLVPALRELGFGISHTPPGAFYIYANIDKLAQDGEQLCRDMLERANVAITPGTDFGHNQSSQHVRFSYTEPLPRLEEAMARLKRALQQ